MTTTNDRADFGSLGASAYPGALAHSWSAELVEPPEIRRLRELALERLVPLGEIAPPRSGIPTRAVKFFCVEETRDATLLEQHGIATQRDRNRLALVQSGDQTWHVLERSSLRPMVRNPDALASRALVDARKVGEWQLFFVHDDKPALEKARLSHTLAYLEHGEKRDFRAPQGSRRQGGVPAGRAQIKVRGEVWWSLPTIAEDEGRVAFLKGRGDRHYAPVLPAGLLIPDNFLYSVPPRGTEDPCLLGAIANLSWTHLMCEIHGRRAGGDGVLHTYIRELCRLPIPDPRQMKSRDARKLVELFRAACGRPTLPLSEELREPDRQDYDRWAMRWLFGPDEAEKALATVERALRDLCAERQQRAASGRDQERLAARRQQFDPVPVAERLLRDEGTPPKIGPRLLVDATELGCVVFEVSGRAPGGGARAGSSLFDKGTVRVDGLQEALRTPSAQHADALVALLQCDPALSGTLAVPSDRKAVARLVAEWRREFAAWAERVDATLDKLLPGAKHAEQRKRVRRELARLAGVDGRLLVAEDAG